MSAPVAEGEPESSKARVYREGELVLEVSDRPGILISKMAPPPHPGDDLERHPFLSGTAHLAQFEGIMRDLLEASSSYEGFLGALRAAGFEVVLS